MSSFDWFVIGAAIGFLAALATHKIFRRQRPAPMTEEDYWLG